jgi:hypothetical protein
MTKRIILVLLATLFAANVLAEPVELPTNKDGSIITGVLTAGLDPLDFSGGGRVYPFPFNLFYLDLDTFEQTGDLTLVIPVDDPEDFGDPSVALSAMDGFSTTEKWIMNFVDDRRLPGSIDPASVIPGHSVRVFQVAGPNFLVVSAIVRELTPGVDYFATVAPGGVVAIIPLKPLAEMTNYMAVLTNDIKDTSGNDATPDNMYHLLKQTTPWVDENGHSTYSAVSDEYAQILEGVRPLVNSWEAAAASAGVVPEDIILSWPVQTQSITPVLKQVRSIAKPAPTIVGPTGMNTTAIGGAGIADVYAGIITLPYYLGVPYSNPMAPLTDFWKAAPGAYVPPFDALPDKTSTHVTLANPFPVLTDMQTVPLMMSVPNAGSGQMKPAAGWPVVIFGHAMQGNRSQMLALADTAALAGFAVIAIDFPLHGIHPDDPLLGALHVENTVFAPIANERTFDLDFVNNTTGAPGTDESADPSGTHFLQLGSLLTNRDNFRQGVADLSTLAVTLPSIDINGDTLPDLDASNVVYAGISLGSIHGSVFAAIEPMVNRAFLSTPMGGVMRGFEGSASIGPKIQAGLAAKEVLPGTSDYEQFFIVAQTVFDSADPVNWGAETARHNSVVVHEVMGDLVFPNGLQTAPLSGTEPLIKVMDLTTYSSTQQAAGGVKLAGKFVPPADHGSFLNPAASPAATVEMQKQFASFIATKGAAVVVNDTSTMVQAAQMQTQAISDLREKSNSKKRKDKKGVKPPGGLESASRPESRKIPNRLNDIE